MVTSTLHAMHQKWFAENCVSDCGGRQGIEDHFLEQWHQKLHTNTTPADITICESYIDFLHSGDGGQFWHSLWERGGLTREALATMDHPITGGGFRGFRVQVLHLLWQAPM